MNRKPYMLLILALVFGFALSLTACFGEAGDDDDDDDDDDNNGDDDDDSGDDDNDDDDDTDGDDGGLYLFNPYPRLLSDITNVSSCTMQNVVDLSDYTEFWIYGMAFISNRNVLMCLDEGVGNKHIVRMDFTNPSSPEMDFSAPTAIEICGMTQCPDGAIYALSNSTNDPAEHALYSVDTVTLGLNKIGDTPCRSYCSLACDPDSGVLYAAYGPDETVPSLYTVDKATGTNTLVGEIDVDPPEQGISIEFEAESGVLFMVYNLGLYEVDPDTATATLNCESSDMYGTLGAPPLAK